MSSLLDTNALTAHLCKYLAFTDGRDKLYKFFHYGAKFLGWWFTVLMRNQVTGDYWYNIDRTISEGRKLLRAFKFIEELYRLRTLKEPRTAFFIGQMCKCLFMALYYLFNNISYLAGHKIIDANAQKHMKWSLYCWLIALLFAFSMDVTLYRENKRSQLKAKGKKEELAFLKTQGTALQLAIIREVANIQISSSLVDINPIGNNGLTGLAGMVEAALGAYQIWNRK
eukprot:TRINITY_DN656_c0_g1_i1.p1 TRINITY_DN656_c0_g1~~TRINITY_DN656_c0_g1_i1.p1  ORF type:complete len:226 (-),score=41.66 TRINITY_DN656_c0_g1_i1:107-784(-)